MKTVLISFAALALAGTAANARPILVAAEPVPTAHVRFADLNLDSAEGRTALRQRIHGAAEDLCITGGDRALDVWLEGRRCYKTAVADGLRQMDRIVGQRSAGGSGL